MLYECAKEEGAYLVSLLVCDRMLMPKTINEEEKRGGTKEEPILPRPIEEEGQSIIIHAVQHIMSIFP